MAAIGNSPTQQAFTPAIDYFSGNGSTTAFTLSRPVASVAQVQVTIDNVAQNPSSAYTVSANTITFTSAPLSGTNNIYVYYTSPITQVIAPGQGTVNTTALGNITNIASGNSSLTLQTGSGNTTAVTVDTSQNVGIGGTPTQKLDVVGTARVANTTGNKYLLVGQSTPSGNDGVSLEFQNSNAQKNWAIRSNFNVGGGLEFCPSSSAGGTSYTTPSMVITSAGDLVVGKTATGVGTQGFGAYSTGEIEANAGSNPAAYFNRTNDGTIMQFRRAGTTVGTISVSTGATAYNTSSDYRLKENIAPMTGALAKVAQLKPVIYKWKADGSDGEGFIAHELAEVVPHAVNGDKDAVDADGNPVYQGIDTSFLVATLTAAIQELSAKNDALTARIEALENR